jgi:hypothetical protein
MNVWKPIAIASSSALAVLLACGGGQVAVTTAGAGQPHMETARDHISAAKAELQAAESNKGGHRETALGLCDNAIAEINAGIEYAKTH